MDLDARLGVALLGVHAEPFNDVGPPIPVRVPQGHETAIGGDLPQLHVDVAVGVHRQLTGGPEVVRDHDCLESVRQHEPRVERRVRRERAGTGPSMAPLGEQREQEDDGRDGLSRDLERGLAAGNGIMSLVAPDDCDVPGFFGSIRARAWNAPPRTTVEPPLLVPTWLGSARGYRETSGPRHAVSPE